MKFFCIMHDDVHTYIAADRIILIDSVGDSLTVTTDRGERLVYERCHVAEWEDDPRMTYLDVINRKQIEEMREEDERQEALEALDAYATENGYYPARSMVKRPRHDDD